MQDTEIAITQMILLWFENNYMKMNENKGHLLVFGRKENEVTVSISGSFIQESDEEKLLSDTRQNTELQKSF